MDGEGSVPGRGNSVRKGPEAGEQGAQKSIVIQLGWFCKMQGKGEMQTGFVSK